MQIGIIVGPMDATWKIGIPQLLAQQQNRDMFGQQHVGISVVAIPRVNGKLNFPPIDG